MKTLSEILLETDSERRLKELAADRAREAFVSGSKELTELIDRRKELSLSLIGCRLVPEESGMEPSIRTELAAVNKRIHDKYGKALSSFEPDYCCPLCRDTGYTDDTHMCGCLLERIFHDIYGGAEIGALKGSFGEYDVNVFGSDEQKKRMQQARKYCERLISGQPRSRASLLITGKSGLGKSYLMSCMAKELYNQTRSVLYISSFDLFSVFHRSRLGESIPLSPIFEADALFIDDLGTEPMTQNVTQEYMFRLTDERIRKDRLTVMTTNLKKTQLIERYTEKVTSRLFSSQTGAVLGFEGDDVRI